MSDPRPSNNVRRVDFGKAGDKAVAASVPRASARGARLVDHPSRLETGESTEAAAIPDPAQTVTPSASIGGTGEIPGRLIEKVVPMPSGDLRSRSTPYGRQSGVLILAVMLAAILGATLAAILLNPAL